MPVKTQLRRNGEPVKVGGWSWWHLGVLHKAMQKELGEDASFFPQFSYTFKEKHSFTAPETEIWTDGEPGKKFTLTIEPGDEYHAWR